MRCHGCEDAAPTKPYGDPVVQLCRRCHPDTVPLTWLKVKRDGRVYEACRHRTNKYVSAYFCPSCSARLMRAAEGGIKRTISPSTRELIMKINRKFIGHWVHGERLLKIKARLIKEQGSTTSKGG